jgi:hypothetical protein
MYGRKRGGEKLPRYILVSGCWRHDRNKLVVLSTILGESIEEVAKMRC